MGINASQLTLLVYAFGLVPAMLLGFYFARSRRFSPHHKLVMTGVTVFNWVLIGWIMVGAYSRYVAPYLVDMTKPAVLLPTLHLITGGMAQLLATYLVLLMWTENTRFARLLPYRIQRIKTPMRVTLVLWLVAVLLGFATYATWQAAANTPKDSAPPALTEPARALELPTVAPTDASSPAATESAGG